MSQVTTLDVIARTLHDYQQTIDQLKGLVAQVTEERDALLAEKQGPTEPPGSHPIGPAGDRAGSEDGEVPADK